MARSTVDWTDTFETRTGLDQLGMRLASEGQYSQLIDFTNTVTWHPRYYSFLAWATRRAFQVARGPKGVERGAWERTVRRLDYLVAAATLAGERSATAIIGSDKLRPLIESAESRNAEVEIRDDHVGGGRGAGSLEVYGGTMEGLGLLAQKDGISGPTPRGMLLADAFEASLKGSRTAGASATIDDDRASVASLKAFAEYCGIHQLHNSAAAIPAVQVERDVLREQIVDWATFDARPQTRFRLQSIAIALRCHELTGGDASTADFREAVLTGGIRNRGALAMPAAYDRVLRCWHVYQIHAHSIFALESLLALCLCCLESHAPRRLVRRATLLADIAALLARGQETGGAITGMADLATAPLANTLCALDPLVRGAWGVEAEPGLESRLRGRRTSAGRFRDASAATRDAALLLLLSLARLRACRADLSDGWISTAPAWRQTPSMLLAHVDTAVTRGVTTEEYLRAVLGELVLKQHGTNANRKLAEQARQSTALFQQHGDEFEVVAMHYPGTTNPRFDNAASFLADLGYLDGEPRTLTTDGRALLDQITQRSQQ